YRAERHVLSAVWLGARSCRARAARACVRRVLHRHDRIGRARPCRLWLYRRCARRADRHDHDRNNCADHAATSAGPQAGAGGPRGLNRLFGNSAKAATFILLIDREEPSMMICLRATTAVLVLLAGVGLAAAQGVPGSKSDPAIVDQPKPTPPT